MSFSKFMRRQRKRWPPIIVHFICLIIGLVMSISGWLLHDKMSEFKSSLPDTLIALGVSILASAFINALVTLKETVDLNWKAFEKAFYESITVKDRIRHLQRVELIFKIVDDAGKRYMKVSTQHSFDFRNDTHLKQDYKLMKLFNDYHPPMENGHFDFACKLYVDNEAIPLKFIHEGSKMEISVEDTNRSTKELHPNESMHIRYEIENFYDLNDRLIWSFQEISDGAVIALSSNDDAQKGTYFITLLHPEAEDIRKKHKNYFDKKQGNIKMAQSEEIPIEIKISNIILPYQGFEIAWKV